MKTKHKNDYNFANLKYIELKVEGDNAFLQI